MGSEMLLYAQHDRATPTSSPVFLDYTSLLYIFEPYRTLHVLITMVGLRTTGQNERYVSGIFANR